MKKKLVITLLLLVISISLFSCSKNNQEVVSINDRIEELNNNQDNKSSIIEIMNIKEDIKKLTNGQIKWVKTKTLNKISNKVSNELKESVEWKDCLSKDIDFKSISDFIDLSTIDKIMLVDDNSNPRYDASSSTTPPIVSDEEYIIKLCLVIDIPYALVIDKDNYISALNSLNDLDKVSWVHFMNSDTNTTPLPTIYFYGQWMYLTVVENDETNIYASLIKITKEQLDSLFSVAELNKIGYYNTPKL